MDYLLYHYSDRSSHVYGVAFVEDGGVSMEEDSEVIGKPYGRKMRAPSSTLYKWLCDILVRGN